MLFVAGGHAACGSGRSPVTTAHIAAVASVALAVTVVGFVYWSSRKKPQGTTSNAQQRKQQLAAAAAPQLQRQVFLSHTAKDKTAKHFTASVLKPALELAGLKVVIDYEYLQPGVDWSQELVDAAANSAVFVAVLSRSYSQRFWCMLELDLALNAHGLRAEQQQESSSTLCPAPLIIPVFLDEVDSIVQPQSISQFWQQAAAAWEGLEVEEVGALGQRADWADAECWATNTAALLEFQNERLSSYTGKDELHQLARAVVQAAMRQLPPRVAEGVGVVGLEERVMDLVVQLSSGHLGVWLSGAGGKGKTTLAKQLMNQLLVTGLFHCSAFVEVQHDDGDNIVKVASHLKGALAELTGKEASSWSAARLAEELKQVVASRRVLYVLDNVWTRKQLQHLLPIKWGEGSMVIITSREMTMNCLELRMVEKQLLFHAVEGLDNASARQLFRACAGLPNDGPPAALLDLERQLLQSCAGLPLALSIVGGGLHDSLDPLDWQAALEAFQQGDPAADTAGELWGVLDHSLQGMNRQAISMFLDVATVLQRWLKDDALSVWEGWHGGGARGWLKDLQRRSLVEVGKDGRLTMHDVVLVLGRRMVLDSRGDHHGTRVWVEYGRVMGVPKEGSAGHPLLAAVLEDEGFHLPPELAWPAQRRDWSMATVVVAAPKVLVPVHIDSPLLWLEVGKLSQLVGVMSFGQAALAHVRQLRGLHVRDCSGLFALPECLALMTRLRVLHLEHCLHLEDGLEHVSGLPALQVLRLKGCGRLAELPSPLPPSLSQLQLLDCWGLQSLPDSLCDLSLLKVLQLIGCHRLEALPSRLGQLTLLQCLDVRGASFDTLPASLSQLASLQELRLIGSSNLVALPKSLGQLRRLTMLDMAACPQLAALPDSVSELTLLQALLLNTRRYTLKGAEPDLLAGNSISCPGQECCDALAALPQSLGQLTCLTRLALHGCTQLAALPNSVGCLASLQMLTLQSCTSLGILPDSVVLLTRLTSLDLAECCQLASLPASLGRLVLLMELDLRGCSLLASLPASVGMLTSLRLLNMAGCTSLATLPDVLHSLTALSSLELHSCSQLGTVPGSVGCFVSLQTLDLSNCSSLTALPESLGCLTSLTELKLAGCEHLAALPSSVGELVSLQWLDLRGCSHLRSLPDTLGGWKSLSMDTDAAGRRLRSIFGSSSAHEWLRKERALDWQPTLDLSDCCQLSALPASIGLLGGLEVLCLNGCSELTSLPETLGGLSSLQKLLLSDCSKLLALPDCLEGLVSLVCLQLGGCSQLTVLPDSVACLTGLQWLGLCDCSQLAALPSALGRLASLQGLDLRSCCRLEALPASLGDLTLLTALYLAQCDQLVALPQSLGQLASLVTLDLQGCTSLPDLHEELASLSKCASLTRLSARECTQLVELPDALGEVISLRHLDLSGCSQLVGLPQTLCGLASLQGLNLQGCCQMQALSDSLAFLTKLTGLCLQQCHGLTELPDSLGLLAALQWLDLHSCSQLEALPETIGDLWSLEYLRLDGCISLAFLPESIGHLTSLMRLTARGCSQLVVRRKALDGLAPWCHVSLFDCIHLPCSDDESSGATGSGSGSGSRPSSEYSDEVGQGDEAGEGDEAGDDVGQSDVSSEAFDNDPPEWYTGPSESDSCSDDE